MKCCALEKKKLLFHFFLAGSAVNEITVNRYQAGFRECVSEVNHYLNTIDDLDLNLKTRVVNHLANTLQNNSAQLANNIPNTNGPVAKSDSTGPDMPIHIAPKTSVNADVNNNVIPVVQPIMASTTPLTVNTSNVVAPNGQANVMSGLQVVPTKLPSGEIAFVLSGSNVPCVIPVYASPQQQNGMMISPQQQTGVVLSPPIQTSTPSPTVTAQATGAATQTPIIVAPNNTSSLKSPTTNTVSCVHNKTPTPPPHSPPPSQEESIPQDLSFNAHKHSHEAMEIGDSDNVIAPIPNMEAKSQRTVNVAQACSADMWRPW